jgi:hypothetical protein
MEMEEKKITMSEQIRQFYDLGMKVKDIAKELGIRYQFAYNVISAYIAEQELQSRNLSAATKELAIPQVPTLAPAPAEIASETLPAPTTNWATVQPPEPMNKPEGVPTLPPRTTTPSKTFTESFLAKFRRA